MIEYELIVRERGLCLGVEVTLRDESVIGAGYFD